MIKNPVAGRPSLTLAKLLRKLLAKLGVKLAANPVVKLKAKLVAKLVPDRAANHPGNIVLYHMSKVKALDEAGPQGRTQKTY